MPQAFRRPDGACSASVKHITKRGDELAEGGAEALRGREPAGRRKQEHPLALMQFADRAHPRRQSTRPVRTKQLAAMQAQPAVSQTVQPPQRATSQSTAVAGSSYPCQGARQRSRNTWASHGRPPRRCPRGCRCRAVGLERAFIRESARRTPFATDNRLARRERGVCATVALRSSTTIGALAIPPPSGSLVHHGGSFADSPAVGFRAPCATRSVARRSHSHEPSASPVGLRSSARSLTRTRYAHPRPGRKAPEDLCGRACSQLSTSWSGAVGRNKRRRAHEQGHRDQALRSDHREEPPLRDR